MAAAGEPSSVPAAVAERTASTRASGARRASKAADLRSGKARGWDEEARSARRAEERPSAAAGARPAGGLTKWLEMGSGCGAAAATGVEVTVVVQRERHRSGGEEAARSRGGRMVAGGRV